MIQSLRKIYSKRKVLTVRAHVDRRPCDLRVNERRSHEQNSAEPRTQTSRTHLTNSLDNRHFPRFNQFSALISSLPTFPSLLSISFLYTPIRCIVDFISTPNKHSQ